MARDLPLCAVCRPLDQTRPRVATPQPDLGGAARPLPDPSSRRRSEPGRARSEPGRGKVGPTLQRPCPDLAARSGPTMCIACTGRRRVGGGRAKVGARSGRVGPRSGPRAPGSRRRRSDVAPTLGRGSGRRDAGARTYFALGGRLPGDTRYSSGLPAAVTSPPEVGQDGTRVSPGGGRWGLCKCGANGV